MSYDGADEKICDFHAHMVEFCRPDHKILVQDIEQHPFTHTYVAVYVVTHVRM